jgi:hypothetical protein
MKPQAHSRAANAAAETQAQDKRAEIVGLLSGLRDELWAHERKQYPELENEPDPEPIIPIGATVVDTLVQRYELPAAYSTFLKALGKQSISLLPGPFQELVVYSAPEIEQAQVGFRGMRPGDDSFVAPHGWRRTWIVIAYDNGDPYFIDTAKPLPDGECQIWMAMHGTGNWEPRLVASSLGQFLRILRVWARIVVSHYDPQNPDEPLDDAHLRRLTNEITQIDAKAADHWTI